MRTVVRSSTWSGLLILWLSILAGCAAAPAPPPDLDGPDYFSDATQPDVVLGYFTEPRNLGSKSCLDEENLGAFGHCDGPSPTVTLVVQDVIFGHVEQARLELSAHQVKDLKRFPLGSLKPVLAYPSRYGTLSAANIHRLVRTGSGEWAMPVGSEGDLPYLPCRVERFLKPHAIEFARPRPTRALGEYDEDEIEELEANPDVTIRNGMVEYRAGILLSEIYALRDRIPTLGERDQMYVQPCLRKKAIQ
jgi:hypothetical protein